jgi:hypothetical protein
VSQLDEQRRLMELASANLRPIPFGVAFHDAQRAYAKALPGDEPMTERIERAREASNDVWRKALVKVGVTP